MILIVVNSKLPVSLPILYNLTCKVPETSVRYTEISPFLPPLFFELQFYCIKTNSKNKVGKQLRFS